MRLVEISEANNVIRVSIPRSFEVVGSVRLQLPAFRCMQLFPSHQLSLSNISTEDFCPHDCMVEYYNNKLDNRAKHKMQGKNPFTSHKKKTFTSSAAQPKTVQNDLKHVRRSTSYWDIS